ncbi:MAG: anhydro-N-acetylmuramic acid kinase [Acidobacteriota bacterium]|nr:anhydro-N-acetylmuramic acid kinase [Acidobacteriota bacterium]
MRVAGIMSGTSLDGIDVAIVEISGKEIRTVTHRTTPYSQGIRARILKAANPADISRLNFELGKLYAKAVLATGEKVDLIGCHGQTVYHEGNGPRPNTLQIGEASVMAERVGVPVVSDFRTRDIAAGGKGAPLVPFVDYLLFADKQLDRVALNIGGIANITILPRNVRPESVIAFDTGPGNMVIDQLVERMTSLATSGANPGAKRFDRDGAIAARGHVNAPLLATLLRDRYYRKSPPKTAGREEYGAVFVDRLMDTGLPIEDLIATATALTAATIAAGIPASTRQLIAAGGGVHNRQLMAQLAAFLPACRVSTTAEFDIDPDAKEAIAFAILAYRTWKHRTGNLPSATGARRAVILGKITI